MAPPNSHYLNTKSIQKTRDIGDLPMQINMIQHHFLILARYFERTEGEQKVSLSFELLEALIFMVYLIESIYKVLAIFTNSIIFWPI